MNLLNLPVFILLFAIIYLSIVYGLLKMAQAQKTSIIMTPNTNDANQKIETKGDGTKGLPACVRPFRVE